VTEEPLNILFLSPHNACRSIMAEALLMKLGRGKFRAFSAGAKPGDRVNPYVAETLKQVGYDTSEQFPKSWNEFVTPSAPRIDAVITLDAVLKNARLPIWYSNPVVVNWDFQSPDDVDGDDRERIGAYRRCYGDMEQQILKLSGQPVDGLKGTRLERVLASIAP